MTVLKSDAKVACNGDFAHEWIVKDSVKYVFVRAAYIDDEGGLPLSQLADNECVFFPGGVYVREEDLVIQK